MSKPKKEKKLNLFGSVYRIKQVDSILKDGEESVQYGNVNHVKHLIQIASKIKVDNEETELSQEEMDLTLLHELFHAFLQAGQYNSCSDDEPLVEWLARCTYAAIKQKVIEL